MGKTPKWLAELGEPKTTRARSGKQEKKIAKELLGKPMLNSGATFGQNDVVTKDLEIEAKITGKQSFSLKLSDLKKAHRKCAAGKMPVMIVEFETEHKEYAVINYDDLKFLLNHARNGNERV